ncbi:MAG: methyl-accepting chemotaxis protein [Deferribacteraceae bacterium]|jgi:methyl-accepting chemotaxis protein|nr:methyl-accepting chemotaxis protein [Deferribacteraceae bacterium]
MKLSLQTKLFNASVLPLIIVFVGIIILTQIFVKGSLRENAISLAGEIAVSNELKIGDSLKSYVEGLQDLAHNTEELIGSGADRAMVWQVVQKHIERNGIFAGGIILEPDVVEADANYAGDPESLLYSESGQFLPYYNQSGDGYVTSSFIMYKNEAWYEPVMLEGRTFITEPYIYDFVNEIAVDTATEAEFASGDKQMILSIATPLRIDGKLVGAVMIDMLVGAFSEYAGEIKPFGTGNAILMSNEGVIIYSPYAGQVNESFSNTTHIEGFSPADVTKAIANNQPISFFWSEANNGNKMYSILRPISLGAASWGLLVSMNVDDAYSAVGLDSIQYITLSMLFVVFIIIIVASLFIRFNIIRYVHEFTSAMVDITDGDGDLTKTINIKSGDEFEDLALHLNKFLQTMRAMIVEIGEQANESARSSQMLAEAADTLHMEFEVQSREVESVASAVEEMSGSAREVAHTTDSSNVAVDGTRQEIVTGQRSLAEAISAMDNITKNTESLAQTINTLGESSDKIGDILNVINDIADQTNLLALNAAIEAARAGDAGRGFAVVADEVRKLAERTQSATNEIQAIIVGLQRDTKQAATEMNGAGQSVVEGAKRTSDVDAVFVQIVGSMKGIQDNAGLISTAAGEQATALQGLSQNARQISAGIDKSKDTISEFHEITAFLADSSSTTSRLVSRFKVK